MQNCPTRTVFSISANSTVEHYFSSLPSELRGVEAGDDDGASGQEDYAVSPSDDTLKTFQGSCVRFLPVNMRYSSCTLSPIVRAHCGINSSGSLKFKIGKRLPRSKSIVNPFRSTTFPSPSIAVLVCILGWTIDGGLR